MADPLSIRSASAARERPARKWRELGVFSRVARRRPCSSQEAPVGSPASREGPRRPRRPKRDL